jgi:hypothetical protein
MLARLRLLLAMTLLCLGTWFAAQALEGYLPAGPTTGPQSGAPSPGLAASPDAQQFISFVTRERLVVEGPTTRQAKSPTNSANSPAKLPANSQAKAPANSQLEATSPQGVGSAKPAAIEKRRPASTAQLPWPLSLLSD